MNNIMGLPMTTHGPVFHATTHGASRGLPRARHRSPCGSSNGKIHYMCSIIPVGHDPWDDPWDDILPYMVIPVELYCVHGTIHGMTSKPWDDRPMDCRTNDNLFRVRFFISPIRCCLQVAVYGFELFFCISRCLPVYGSRLPFTASGRPCGVLIMSLGLAGESRVPNGIREQVSGGSGPCGTRRAD